MLTNEQIVRAWKDPELRKTLVGVPNHPSSDINIDFDMNEFDACAETTPAILASSVICGEIAATIVITVAWCGR